MKTVGEELARLGFETTNWLDSQTGARRVGKFDPSGTTWEQRYGVSIAGVKGWDPGDAVGFHVSGDNNNLMDPSGTTLLAARILGVPPGPWDILDVSFLDGAASFLLAEGRDRGIIPPRGAQVIPDPRPPAPVPPPVVSSPVDPAPAQGSGKPSTGPTGNTAGGATSPTPGSGEEPRWPSRVNLGTYQVLPVTMRDVLTIEGVLRPGFQTPKKGYAVMALAVAANLELLPKRWLLFGLQVRNRQVVIETHGFGVLKPGHAKPIRTEISTNGPLHFGVEYDGRNLEIGLNGQVFETTTELVVNSGDRLALVLGIPPGKELLQPSGWTIEDLVVG